MNKILYALVFLIAIMSFAFSAPEVKDINFQRWHLMTNEWGDETLFLKGRFFKANLGGGDERTIAVYRNPNFSGEPSYRFAVAGVYSDKESCEIKSIAEEKEISPHIKCGYLS